MAIRERVVEANGHVRHVAVPGYTDSRPNKKELPKMSKTATAPKKASLKEKLKHSENSKPKGRVEKSTFKAAIMALDNKNVYRKTSEHEIETEKDFRSAFEKWLDSGALGEFIAIRRK